MAITEKTRKGLWGRSGNRCAICKTELVLEKDPFNAQLNIGEECHLISKQQGGPRHETVTNFDYDDGDNLVLLCRNHHRQIDEQIAMFPVGKLKLIKLDHEQWVKDHLASGSSGTTAESPKKSSFEAMMDLIIDKHDTEMNIKSSREVLQSPEGLAIAFKEVALIKEKIHSSVATIRLHAPSYTIEVRDNSYKICDIIFKGFTFLAQFYQAYSNSADKSYLLFAIVKGHFDEQGHADIFEGAHLESIIRLNFSYNDKGEFGWRDQENKDKFYSSNEITEIWLEKYFTRVIV